MSRKEISISMDEHFHKLLIFQELDMSGSADPGVQILIFDLEIDIQPKEHFRLHTT